MSATESNSSRTTRRLHIFHVHQTPAFIGGSEQSLQLSMQYLRAKGHKATLLCGTTSGKMPMPDVNNLIALPELFLRDPLPFWRRAELGRLLLSEVDRLSPDVVHIRGNGLQPYLVEHLAAHWPTVYSPHNPVCPNGARYLYRDRSICTAPVSHSCITSGFRAHGCGHLSTGDPVSAPAFARALLTTKKLLRAMKRCQCVLASSTWQAETLIRDGLPSDRVAVVHPPITPMLRAPSDNEPTVVFAGRLVEFKGADHLLRASSCITSPHRVWIIGDGPARQQLEQFSTELGIDSRVTFWGAMEPDRIHELMAHATVVVVPSLWPETFNQVGAQAATGGHHVVAYDAAGMQDWGSRYSNVVLVEHGQWHLLADAIDVILASLDQPIGAVPNYFSSDAHTESLLKIYNRAVACGI